MTSRRRWLVGTLAWAATCAAAAGWSTAAHGYEFNIDLRTIGQGYQVRRFGADGNNELLTRRRLTQYLDLNIYDIAPDRWRGDDGGRNILYFDSSLRFDSDFGGYMLARPTGENEIRELKQSQIDLLFGFFGGRNIGGRLDFQIGRQIHFDLVDFFSFDGADAIVRLGRGFSVQGFSGTEVRGEAPLSAPIFEVDGTSAGSRDPVTRPGQASSLRPLIGAALANTGGQGRAVSWTARVAYRRVWSATADQLPDEPSSGVNDEKIGLTANVAFRDRAYLWGGVRYNLLLATFDDQQLSFRVRLPRRQAVTLEHSYLAPTFDGDSIWNVFAAGAYRDLRAIYELGIGPEVKTYARGFVRFFADSEPYGTGVAGGGSLGAVWRRGRGLLRADSYWDDGYGGRKLGLDVVGRVAVRTRVELEARLTSYEWRSDQRPLNDNGVVVGGQAGGRFILGPGLRLHLLAEDNVGTYYKSQYRGLAILEVDASL